MVSKLARGRRWVRKNVVHWQPINRLAYGALEEIILFGNIACNILILEMYQKLKVVYTK